MNFATTSQQIEDAYTLARERYTAIGVDTEQALETLRSVPISLQCWQGDDVLGFEQPDRGLGGGLMATGNYPGRARTVDELRSDLDIAYSVIPGSHRLNLHAMYPDTDESPPRNEIAPRHFQGWAQWARENGRGIDFNPTLFSHPLADDGFTLASYDNDIRQFWIQHCIACREIGAFFGQELGTPAMTNIWIPDGLKDSPSDRTTPRQLLNDALDQIFEKEIDPNHNRDAVECKLFGLGSESYVVGSHEFYLGYAARNDKALCLDAGHFHPTEVVSDKISACLLFVPELVLHVSRGVRWDSDHVVTFSDELQAIMQEIVRGCHLDRVHIGLDYFDASINRVAAWAIGTRNSLRALLLALLEPRDALQEIERKADYTTRLALMEELKVMPHAAVWDYHCLQQDVPIGMAFLDDIRSYEKDVLSHRG